MHCAFGSWPWGMVALAGGMLGCNVLIGLDEPKDRVETAASSSSSGAGGSGAMAGFGGLGGMGGMGAGGGACVPGNVCPTGMLGACAVGRFECSPATTCVPMNQPSIEQCSTMADENCDGVGCVGNHVWSKRFGDMKGQRAEEIVYDSQGNLVVCGQFDGTINLGDMTLTSIGAEDIFVAKFDSTGKLLWNVQYGGNGYQGAWGMGIDAQDNLYLTGGFNGTLTFGNITLMTSDTNDWDPYVAKLDSLGKPLWAKSGSGAGYQATFDLALDSAGNSAIVGILTSTLDFGGSLSSFGGDDILVASFDSNGNRRWAKHFGTTTYQGAYGVATDDQGNVFFTGYSDSAIDFGGGVLGNSGAADAALVKLDRDGGHIWSKLLGDAQEQGGFGVVVNSAGGPVMGLKNHGTISFGGGQTLTSGATGDIGLIQFNAAGAYAWSRRFFNTGAELFDFALAVDAENQIIAGGAYQGSMDFGGGTLMAAGTDLALLKLNPTGTHIWSKRFSMNGTSGKTMAKDVLAGTLGEVYMVGHFDGALDFGNGDLTSAGDLDAFIARFTP